ncbi:MAG: right-handed parallel beta-helix repeat-containing protein, partial [Planctomycetota bacterium]
QAINNSSPGDEIVIANGTYSGSIDTLGNDLTIRSESGDPTSVTIYGNAQFAVYVASFETVTIQNVTIVNPALNRQGIFVHNGSNLNLEGCRIRNVNTWDEFPGALVHARGSSSVFATDCVFEDASSETDGGAIAVTDGSQAGFVDCTFDELSSEGLGGAVYAFEAAAVGFLRCSFTNSHADVKGGAIHAITTPVALTECSFQGNSSGQSGGAIYMVAEHLTVDDSAFDDNQSSLGGAIFLLTSATATIRNSTFRENSVTNNGGAIHATIGYSIEDCGFFCNVAESGGGLWLGNAAKPGQSLSGCFLALNEATAGGGIFSLGDSPEISISSTTLCGNSSDQIEGGYQDDGGNVISDGCFTNPPITCDTEWPLPLPVCPADLDGDGVVGVDDQVILILAWGTSDPQADINQDGVVGVDDLTLLILGWGPCDA